MTEDMRQATCDRQLVTCYMRWWLNIVSICQVHSSYSLGVKVFGRFRGKESLIKLIMQEFAPQGLSIAIKTFESVNVIIDMIMFPTFCWSGMHPVYWSNPFLNSSTPHYVIFLRLLGRLLRNLQPCTGRDVL